MRFPRPPFAALGTLAALAALAACGNSTGLPPAHVVNVVDTVSLYALDGTPLTAPSAYDVETLRTVRTDVTTAYDFIFNNWNTVIRPMQAISYSIWVPHRSNGILVPPMYFSFPPPAGTVPPVLFAIDTNPPIHAAVRLGEKVGVRNPILSDAVYCNLSVGWPNPVNVDFSTVSQRNYQTDYGGHYRKGALDSLNACYVDGHVERIPAKQVKVRYGSQNAWVCR